MRYLFAFMFIFLNSLVKAETLNNTSEKKCINEFLLPCSSTIIFTNVDNKPEKNLNSDQKKTIQKNKNKSIISGNFDESTFTEKKKLQTNKSNISNKIVSINDIPSSDFDKNISFEKFKSSVINYSDKTDYPDINK